MLMPLVNMAAKTVAARAGVDVQFDAVVVALSW
jgi:hypothetical protein